MSFVRPLVLLPVVALLALSAPMPDEPRKPAPEPTLYEIRLADGSQVKMKMLTEELEIQTRYGKLKVPVMEVRRIEVGFRYPEGAEKRIEAAIARMGGADFKGRDAAAAELTAFKELAYPALKRAMRSDDAEIKRRAITMVKELEEKLPAEKLRQRDHDVIFTAQFPIAGKIEAQSLRGASTVFGEVQVQFTELRQVRALTGGGDVVVVVDAARYASPNQNEWLETEVDVEKGSPLRIRAGGTMNLNPQNGNNFMVGPDGNAQWGQNGPYAPGLLVGRIGKNGKQFIVGSRHESEASDAGKLHLRIAPSPWGQIAVGEYSVTVSTELGLGGLGGAVEPLGGRGPKKVERRFPEREKAAPQPKLR